MGKLVRRHLVGLLVAIFFFAPVLAADRINVPSGLQLPSSWLNQQEIFDRVALGIALRDSLGATGTNGIFANLSVTPGTGLNVVVGPSSANTVGSLYQLGVVDVSAFGTAPNSIAANPTQIIVQGLTTTASSPLSVPAPFSAGDSIIYMIEAKVQSTDTTVQSVQIATSPSTISTQSVDRDRVDAIIYQVKAGTASGSPTAPTVDSGWVSIATVTIANGASSVLSGDITAATPFPGFQLAGSGTGITISGGTGITVTGGGGSTPSVALTAPVTQANGGTGTSAPSPVPTGGCLTITGTWPSQTTGTSGSQPCAQWATAAPTAAGYVGTNSSGQLIPTTAPAAQTPCPSSSTNPCVQWSPSAAPTAASYVGVDSSGHLVPTTIPATPTPLPSPSFTAGANMVVTNAFPTTVTVAATNAPTFTGPVTANGIKNTAFTAAGCVQTDASGNLTSISILCEGAPSGYTAEAAAASSGVINAGALRLFSVQVTTLGTAAATITDGSGGSVICSIAASAAVGTYCNIEGGGLAANPLYWNGGTNTPAVTIFWAAN